MTIAESVELQNAVAASAAANDMVTAVKLDQHRDDPVKETLHSSAEIALVTRSAGDMKALNLGPDWPIIQPPAGAPVWMDDYFNVLSAVLFKIRG
jgi:hypothetical protein